MSSLLNIPNEVLDEIVSSLDALDVSNLLLTCRTLSIRVEPAMRRHAIAWKDCHPALHWAALKGHLPLVRYLLTLVPVDDFNDNGDTALHHAANSCHVLITELLLRHGADVSRVNHMGCTPLIIACQQSFRRRELIPGTIGMLLAHYTLFPPEALYKLPKDTIQQDSLRVARVLLDGGASPDEEMVDGEPLIVMAAWEASGVEVIELLMDYDVDIDATNDRSTTALMAAARNGHLAIVKLLVENGANLNLVDRSGDSALENACRGDHNHVFEYLVGCEGLDINREGNCSTTPMQLAVTYGYDTALKILLRRGAATDHVDRSGSSLFHSAILHELEDIVETLLENGEDLEMEDALGRTPLILAIEVQNLEMVTRLLDYWPDLVESQTECFAMLRAACARQSWRSLELLLSLGIDINTVDENGLTVMGHEELRGGSDIIGILASYGAE